MSAPDDADVLDHVLYYVEDEPAMGPRIMSGWLVRKTRLGRTVRPATQADVDAWDPGWPPLAFGAHETFVDGSRPVPRRRPTPDPGPAPTD